MRTAERRGGDDDEKATVLGKKTKEEVTRSTQEDAIFIRTSALPTLNVAAHANTRPSLSNDGRLSAQVACLKDSPGGDQTAIMLHFALSSLMTHPPRLFMPPTPNVVIIKLVSRVIVFSPARKPLCLTDVCVRGATC